MAEGFTHLDEAGKADMVDVTDKAVTERTAVAEGMIRMPAEVFKALYEGKVPKGDVFATARIAGIMAAKQTSGLIPLCHPLMLSKVSVDFEKDEKECAVICRCMARLSGKTGVEMEALTGVSVALLTIYDMCKALSKTMEITDIHLVKKTGGKSGVYERGE